MDLAFDLNFATDDAEDASQAAELDSLLRSVNSDDPPGASHNHNRSDVGGLDLEPLLDIEEGGAPAETSGFDLGSASDDNESEWKPGLNVGNFIRRVKDPLIQSSARSFWLTCTVR